MPLSRYYVAAIFQDSLQIHELPFWLFTTCISITLFVWRENMSGLTTMVIHIQLTHLWSFLYFWNGVI